MSIRQMEFAPSKMLIPWSQNAWDWMQKKKKRLALTFIVQLFAKLILKMSTILWKIKEWTFGGLIGSKVVMARWIPFGC